jgi:signal transduction histidine kinase/ligand-binding sensor domain-containing protein
MLRVCTLLVLLGTVYPAIALDPHKALTQYSSSVWTQQQGLPQDTIRSITQTSDGYLWLGTDEGLARFDGYQFTIFNRDNGDLPSNSVTALAAGHDGSLWIGSRSGVTRYYEHRFRTYTRKDGLADDLVSALLVDHAGVLWIVAGGNLSRFDGSTFRNFMRERDVPMNSIRAVTEDRDHNIYVSGNSSVVKLVGGKFLNVFEPSALRADFPQALQVDRNGVLWVVGIRGLIERLPNGAIKRYGAREGLSDSFGLNTVAQDRDGTIWVGTNRGIARLEGAQFRARQAPDEPSAVRCIFEDREGNLWIGSNNGLTRFRDDTLIAYGKSEGLPGDEPSAAYQDHNGKIWAGFDDGVVTLTGGEQMLPAPVRGMPTVLARQFRETGNGELLIAAREGLVRFRNGHATTFVAPDPQNRKTVFDALEDSDGTIWLALPNGLGELRGDKFRTIIPAGPLFLENSFNTLAKGSDGSIWVGTLSNGLWRYKDGQKRLYTTADGLGSDQIRSLHQDAGNTLWIGTVDGGLNAFRDGKFVKFTARDGLPSDNIRGVTEDGETLWLSTTRGISRISKSQLRDFAEHRITTLHPVTYGITDGLRSPLVIDGQRHADGSLWFLTGRGIAVYNPHAQETLNLPPMIHLVDMSMDGRRFEVAAKNAALKNAAAADGANAPLLPPGSGRLQIRFTAIHLRAPDRVRYYYRLSGLDSDWVHADGLRAVNYDSLRHGHYRFRIKADLPGGPSSESSFEFDLLPHYYQTGWFRLLVALALAAMIWLAYKLRDRQVRLQFAIVLEERARLAREVHDTLAQGFVGIASQLDVVEMSMPPDAGAARGALELARRMARHSLTEARRSVMDLRAAALEDQDLAVALESGVRLWAANSGIDVKVEASGEAGALPEEVAHHVFRIAQEAVANAVNHADPNQITLTLRINSRQLNLQIVDDGCGFEPEDVFTSRNGNFGLIGMRERAERLDGHLRLESHPSNGTCVDVTVPLK